MKVKLLSITPDSEKLIEFAFRKCYRSSMALDIESTRRFIERKIALGHLSPVEHASATFEVGDISRACSHQIVRHRLASYSQESMRYVEPDYVIIPESLAEKKEFYDAITIAKDAYDKFLSLGIKKEDARFILPIATMTSMVVTMNFRSWLHFIEIRSSEHAQWEIRAVAEEIHEILSDNAPSVFGARR